MIAKHTSYSNISVPDPKEIIIHKIYPLVSGASATIVSNANPNTRQPTVINWGDGSPNMQIVDTKPSKYSYVYTDFSSEKIITVSGKPTQFQISADGSLKSPLEFILYNSSTITNLTNAWYGCSLTTFDTKLMSGQLDKLTTLSGAWRDTGISTFDASGLSLAKNVVSLANSWAGSIQLSNFDSTPLATMTKVTNLGFAWHNCTKLTNFNSYGLSFMTNTTSLNTTWRECVSLTTLNLDYLPYSKVTDTYAMCSGCRNLRGSSAKFRSRVKPVTKAATFYGCKSLSDWISISAEWT